MALATRLSNAAAKAALDALVDQIDVGAGSAKLRIYNGTQPADPDTALSGQTLLAEITLPNPAFGAAGDNGNDALATAAGLPLSDTAADAGTATWFRVLNRNGDAVIDGSIAMTGGTADLILDNTNIAVGQVVNITNWSVRLPGV